MVMMNSTKKNTAARRFAFFAAVFFPAVLLAFFYEPILLKRVFYVFDLSTITLPNQVANAVIRDRGVLPLWNPWALFGYPLSAEPENGALYPLSLIFNLPIAHGQSFTVFILLHYAIAMAGTWFYGRVLGLSPQGRALAVLVFVFGGTFIAQTVNIHLVTTFAWAPWILALQLRSVQDRSLKWAVAAGLLLGVQLLGAHPQMTFYLGLMTIPNGVLGQSGGFKRENILRALRVLAVIYVIGCAIGSPQLLYTYELLRHTERGVRLPYDFLVSYSLPPHYLLQLLVPNFFGSEDSYIGAMNFIELHLYWSVAALGLIILGWRSKNPYALYCRFLIIVCLVLALGRYSYLYHALQYVPGFDVIRAPARMLLPASLMAGMLAGMGLDRAASISAGTIKKLVLFYIALVVVQVGMGIAGLIGLEGGDNIFQSAYQSAAAWLVRGRELPGGLFLQAGAPLPVQNLLDALGDMSRAALLAALFSASVAIWWIFYGRSSSKKGLAYVLLVLVATDLYAFESNVNRYKEPDFYEDVSPIVEYLQEQDGHFRVFPVIPVDNHDPDVSNLGSNIPMLYGLTSIRSFLSMGYTRIDRYLEKRRHSFNISYKKLALANVKYLLSAAPLANSSLKPVLYDGERYLYQLKNAMQRAFFVPQVRVVKHPNTVLKLLRQPDFPARKVAIVNERPVPVPGRPVEDLPEKPKVSITHYGSMKVKLRVITPQSGMLVLSDLFHPGWKAVVNGKERKIHRTNYLFRGLYLSKGEHQITFYYHPKSFYTGFWIAGATLVCLFAIGVVTAARRIKG